MLQLKEGDLDERVMLLLVSMPPQSHTSILQQFFATPVTGMKNPSAYMNGVIMSYKKFGPQQGKVANKAVDHLLADMYRRYAHRAFRFRSSMHPTSISVLK